MADKNVPQDVNVVRGQVKWFDPTKGFGFILADEGGPDILLHANVLRNFGQSSIADGAIVEISVLETDRGLQAVEVMSVTPPASAAAEGQMGAAPDLPEDWQDLDLEPARIKWFDKSKGFGFANVFGSAEDVFIHIETLRQSGLADLQAGEAICLAAEEGKRGRMAVLVRTWDSVIDKDED